MRIELILDKTAHDELILEAIKDLKKDIIKKDKTLKVAREALGELFFAYENKDVNCPHQFEFTAMKKVNIALAAIDKELGIEKGESS